MYEDEDCKKLQISLICIAHTANFSICFPHRLIFCNLNGVRVSFCFLSPLFHVISKTCSNQFSNIGPKTYWTWRGRLYEIDVPIRLFVGFHLMLFLHNSCLVFALIEITFTISLWIFAVVVHALQNEDICLCQHLITLFYRLFSSELKILLFYYYGIIIESGAFDFWIECITVKFFKLEKHRLTNNCFPLKE